MGSIANELIVRGWHQGEYEAPDGSVCLYGAARYAAGIESLTEWEESGQDEYQAALTSAVFKLNGTVSVALYNDDPDRTYDEVLRIAKTADELLGL